MGWDTSSGYIGHSMSKRAAMAYSDGLKPLSKWTKAEIVETIEAMDAWWGENCTLRNISADALKKHFLRTREWHHTGRCFNETSFYGLDEGVVEAHELDALLELDEALRSGKASDAKTAPALVKGSIVYEHWSGSRKHGRFVEREAACIIIGDWAYTESGKKSLNGEHVKSVVRFERAPRGTSGAYMRIYRKLPAKYRGRASEKHPAIPGGDVA